MAYTTTDIRQMRMYRDKIKRYQVFITGQVVHTTVTKHRATVNGWISDVYAICDSIGADTLVVGLDAISIDSHPYQYCILQLCVGCSCLVYQIYLSTIIPLSLINFLAYKNNIFVGIEIEAKLKKLSREYGIGSDVLYIDLGRRAAVSYNQLIVRDFSLRELALLVLEKDVAMPPGAILTNNWDARFLAPMQVLFATIGAFVASQLGWALDVYPISFPMKRILMDKERRWIKTNLGGS